MSHFFKVLRHRAQGVPRTVAELNFSLQLLGTLRALGWQSSVRQHRPIDQNEDAIPWYTYSALEWLKPRVRKSDRVFEYGAGYSTIWYSRFAGQVVAVDDNTQWLNRIRLRVGDNTTLLARPSVPTGTNGDGPSHYSESLEGYPKKSFDIIVIDGKERVQCAHIAPSRLRDDGVIVFDNSDRPVFADAIEHLHALGFGRIDFYGLVPQVGVCICTSIFSKSGSRWFNHNAPLVFQGS